MQKAVMGAILALCLWTGAVAQNMYDIEQELTEENFEASRQKRDELYNRALQQSFLIDYNVGFSKFPKSYTVANSSYRINTEISSSLDIQYYITKHFGVVLDYYIAGDYAHLGFGATGRMALHGNAELYGNVQLAYMFPEVGGHDLDKALGVEASAGIRFYLTRLFYIKPSFKYVHAKTEYQGNDVTLSNYSFMFGVGFAF